MKLRILCISILLKMFIFSLVLAETQTTPVAPQLINSKQEQPRQTESKSPQPTEPPQQPPLMQPLKEKPSEFEQYISGKSPLTISLDIKQFGYELFSQPPTTFAPVDRVPVSPDYVIGPQDEIRITVWGRLEGEWNVTVDRDGNITLPRLGTLGVTGLTFKEVKELLQQEFSKYYTGFQMNVSMGSLRTIRVYVVGNAQRPGAYTLSSLSTLINALFEAGGPNKIGSMRDIQLKRSGKTIVHFDIYDFLLHGDKTKDIKLMPEDVIFIPTVGALVGIAGNVKNPAIYELRGEVKLLDLINMAGGLTGIAFKGRVYVQRIEEHQFRTIFEGDLIDIENTLEKNFILRDGDLIKIFPVVETKNTVTITVAIANPDEYGVIGGITRIKDVISKAGGLLYYASNNAELTRVKVTQAGPQTERIFIDLSEVMKDNPQHNITLEINDYISIKNVPEWRLYQTVTITGEVKFPGTYTIKKGERLSSLLERVGGFTDKAYLKGAVFIRERIRQFQQERIDEMIERLERELLSSSTSSVATASTSDEAKLFQMETEQKKKFIETLRKIRAKGRIVIELSVAENLRQTPFDIELEDGDSIYIPSDPMTVQVVGSVYNQSVFVYEKGNSYEYYVGLSGGYAKNADSGRLYIIKADGRAIRPSAGLFSISEEVESGDAIVIPDKLERIAWMRNIKDITQIFYQIAVTAGVMIVLF